MKQTVSIHAAFALSLLGALSAQAARPNILIIFADDLGYSDIGAYGGEIETPNLDRLAEGGLRMTQFYNSARCCPSRVSLLTGLYPHQGGMGWMAGPKLNWGEGYLGYLSERNTTFAEVLQDAGYTTMMVGKWHAGLREESLPEKRGFQKFTGIYNWVDSYWKILKTCDVWRDGELFIESQENPVNPYRPDEEFYTTDFFTDVAIDYIDQATADDDKPFLLHLCYNAPHFPLETPEMLIEKYRGRFREGWDKLRSEKLDLMKEIGIVPETQLLPDVKGFHNERLEGFVSVGRVGNPLPKWETLSEADQDQLDFRRAMYAGQVDRMDSNIGRIIDHLEANQLLDNTLILFLSDNGCSGELGLYGLNWGKYTSDNYEEWRKLGGWSISQGQCWAAYSNTPFRKYKKFVHEGGIATPFIAHWPAKIAKPGRVVKDQAFHLIDVLPTLAELAGAEYPAFRDSLEMPALPGMSIVPFLMDPEMAPRDRTLYWQHETTAAIREGNWKLVSANDRDPAEWELYDLSNDRSETENLVAEHPAKAAALRAKWEQWAKAVNVVPYPETR